MAISKKGSRSIVVNDINYSWLIRRKVTYNQEIFGTPQLNVAIERADQPGSTLVIHTDRPHSKSIETKATDIIPITPKDVATWISNALELGWNPNVPGPQFLVQLIEGAMSRR
ncbi:MAG: hypothetical protein HRU41_09040 [Saprospiraceae bacterium]|nr:hypothetical protein [Saprospiraceae bacterium]